MSTSVMLEDGLPCGGSLLLFELCSDVRCLTKALISSVSCCFSNWFRIQYTLMAILLRRLNGEEACKSINDNSQRVSDSSVFA